MTCQFSDQEIQKILTIFGFAPDRIHWAVEMLRGRIDLTSLRGQSTPVDRTVYSLPRQGIVEVRKLDEYKGPG